MTDLFAAPVVNTPLYVALSVLIAVSAAVRGVWSPCGLSMISAINPFTESSRGNRYWLTAGWFVAGSVVGGAALGSGAAVGAWLVVPLVGQVTAIAAVACCLLALASDTSVVGFQLPGHPRQVNERWLGRYRRWVYASGFGLQIGSGFATYIMTAAVYLTVALGALSGSPRLALTAGLVFGFVRGSAVLLSGAAKDPAALRRLHRRMELLEPWSMRAVVLVEVSAAGALGYAAGGLLGLVVVGAVLGVVAGRVLNRARQPVPAEVS